MQYALMFYSEPGAGEALSEAERDVARADFSELLHDPRLVVGAQLAPVESATSVRAHAGRTLVTDGPFANTKEVLGGLVLVEAADLDEALELAAAVPIVRFGGVVEVRPVVAR
ncbi:YciI family protein [Segeticoccus rhizosphaerae]|jgi:hypothetical protein|uniref:YciI family protein n=1 Tax=Segeticoccus rhizosphaerae TaxID=1104777 RepID=UPI0010C06CF4|nr:YciI family protein [Ornithinicoccus soli]